MSGRRIGVRNGGDMDFTLQPDEQAVLETAAEFARDKVRPLARELDRTGRFPSELVRGMAEAGLMGIYVPEEFGGAGCTAGVQPRDARNQQSLREHRRDFKRAHEPVHRSDLETRHAGAERKVTAPARSG